MACSSSVDAEKDMWAIVGVEVYLKEGDAGIVYYFVKFAMRLLSLETPLIHRRIKTFST